MTDYRYFVETTGDELWARIDASHRWFAAVALDADPGRLARRSSWTTVQVVAHVLDILYRYTQRDVRSRAGLFDDAAALRAGNDGRLVDLEGRSVTDLLAAIETELRAIRGLLPPSADLDERLPFHGGTDVDVAGALGNLIGEFVVHGWDVARASGGAVWVDRRDWLLIANAMVQTGRGFVRPGAAPVSASIRTSDATPWYLAFESDALVSRPLSAVDRVDVAIRAPASTMVLAFFSRYSLVEGAVHGMMVTGGRRPWRVGRLQAGADAP